MLSKLESKECILPKSNDKSTEHAPHFVSTGKQKPYIKHYITIIAQFNNGLKDIAIKQEHTAIYWRIHKL